MIESAKIPAGGRVETIQSLSNYYLRRAEQHALLATGAVPDAASVHRQFAQAYRDAAAATLRGEVPDFGGGHRADRPNTLPSGYSPLVAAA